MLISGNVPRVIIDFKTRETIQNWVNQLWIEKDRRIDALRAARR
ncbi:hypothetical protein WLY71_00110 [Pseudomonas sp. P2663]